MGELTFWSGRGAFLWGDGDIILWSMGGSFFDEDDFVFYLFSGWGHPYLEEIMPLWPSPLAGRP